MTDDPIAKALLYCRQSLTRGRPDESLSLAMQERHLRELAVRRGWLVVAVVRDPDLKGADANRPGLLELRAAAANGSVDLVAIFAIDRFARDLLLQETVVREIAALGVDLVSATEPWVSTDPMVRQILGSVAENNKRTMGKYLRGAIAERTRRGLPHGGWLPYALVRGSDGRLTPDPDHPERVALVRELFDRYVAGEGSSTLLDDLNARNLDRGKAGARWSHNAILAILDNPAYVGTVRAGGTETPNAHEAIVTPDVWAATRRLRERRSLRRRPNHDGRSWLQGLIACGCGAPMWVCPTTTRGKHGQVWSYLKFRCAATFPRTFRSGTCDQEQSQIVTHLAEAAARNRLIADMVSPRDWATALADARADLDRLSPEHDATRRTIDRRRADVTAQRDRVLSLFAEGKLDAARWAERDDRFAAELAEVERHTAALPQPPDPATYRTAERTIATMADAIAVLPPDDLRRVLLDLGATVVLRHGRIEIDYPEAYRRLLAS